MYQVCRVQKLDQVELTQFDEHFIDHLLEMVETTRNQQDESLNYAVIKLILALNEQFMVSTLPKKEKEKVKDKEGVQESTDPLQGKGKEGGTPTKALAPGSAPIPATSRFTSNDQLFPPTATASERLRSGSVGGGGVTVTVLNANGKNHSRAHTNDGSRMAGASTTGVGVGAHAHDQSEDVKKANRVLMVLMRRLGNSKTFGENIIFMLNRAGELCLTF